MGESSWLAAPYLPYVPPGTIVFHQIRDPLEVVRSKLRIRFFERERVVRTLAFALQHCPDINPGSPFEKSIKYWIYWNLITEQAERQKHLNYFRYRIEDLDRNLLANILDIVGFKASWAKIDSALAQHPKDFNTHGDKSGDDSVTWKNLQDNALYSELRDAVNKYNYNI